MFNQIVKDMAAPPKKNKGTPRARRIFASNLKQARKAAGMTQEDLVKHTGLTQSFISSIESGKSSVSLDNASRLSEALGIPLWKLLSPKEKQ